MRATVGITAGDPAGIGLEVILKSISPILSSARWVLFGDREDFEQNRKRFAPALPYRVIAGTGELADEPALFLLPIGNRRRGIAYLESASTQALLGNLDAIVTAPVTKHAIGSGFRGQTEFFAEQAGSARFAMAFFTPTFKVVLATIHLSLREALDRISTALYLDLIRFVDAELRRFRFDSRRIAVAAINPHGGEGGMFGREDIDILAPAVDRCAAEGIAVTGPHSADSLYYRAHSGEFDVVIAPYHDQGLIPVKLAAHGSATNVTLGLPYVRTSPDHGTALSIAGKGIADPTGMSAALRCALDLVERSR